MGATHDQFGPPSAIGKQKAPVSPDNAERPDEPSFDGIIAGDSRGLIFFSIPVGVEIVIKPHRSLGGCFSMVVEAFGLLLGEPVEVLDKNPVSVRKGFYARSLIA